MVHDVFISHAPKDKSVADAICEKLESAGVRFWIAGRDISAGEDWTAATWNAIGSSRVMVLLLSENAMPLKAGSRVSPKLPPPCHGRSCELGFCRCSTASPELAE